MGRNGQVVYKGEAYAATCGHRLKGRWLNRSRRGLCHICYAWALRHNTLDQHELTTQPLAYLIEDIESGAEVPWSAAAERALYRAGRNDLVRRLRR